MCGRHICSGAYANNVKFMFTGVSGYIVGCSELICSIYTDIVAFICT